jgi:hypothetical protein
MTTKQNPHRHRYYESATCEWCGHEFERSRRDALTCNVRCRKARSRWLSQLDEHFPAAGAAIRALAEYHDSARSDDALYSLKQLQKGLDQALSKWK